ncbi:hypothetical protein EDD86DRAFT_245539 [Gorgonomyces haynaldii]|nr:hypothetical protein EDD86DRAFT_245539 [Gorgonomyces haynaldii]
MDGNLLPLVTRFLAASPKQDYRVAVHGDREWTLLADPMTLLSPSCHVVCYGAPRMNPTVKHSRWIADRQPLEAKRPQGMTEIILCKDNLLYEGLVSNFAVLLYRNGYILQTAPLDTVLPGTMLANVVEACQLLDCFRWVTPIESISTLEGKLRTFEPPDIVKEIQNKTMQVFLCMSLELKREILRRLNQKMKRLGRLNTQKSASMRSLEHSREEYIDRMRQRIDDGDKIEKEKPLERRKLPKSLPQLPEQEIPEFKNITTVQCPSCNRKFLPDRIEKHRQICMGKASRPQFDPKKMRMKGTELESFKPKKPAKEVKKDKGKWRETHCRSIDDS